jgi:hypothetical protein
MRNRIVTIVLAVAFAMSLLLLVPRLGAFRLPGNNAGFEPEQPIAYSHRLHAGELNIPCLYCHSNAEKSRHAGIPSAGTCMNCHRFVTAARSTVRAEEELAKKERRKPRKVIAPELAKLYDSLALDANLKPDPRKTQRPIEWVRIHRIPDFAYFDHRAHVARGIECQKCHGAVETMERVRQEATLNMGWCVNCHRGGANGVVVAGQKAVGSTDCSVCHY